VLVVQDRPAEMDSRRIVAFGEKSLQIFEAF
jgi:hypothetical protein